MTHRLHSVPVGATPHGNRTLHLVDLENLMGAGQFDPDDAASLRDRYTDVSGFTETDLVVVGFSSGEALLSGGVAWTRCRSVYEAGPDGADQALLAVGAEGIANRFARIVIGSGDHIFTDLAVDLQLQGCHVTVVCRRVSLAHTLRSVVTDVRYLAGPDDYTPPSPQALADLHRIARLQRHAA